MWKLTASVLSVISLLILLISSFSGTAMALAPPPPPQWEVGEPFSPVGFSSVSQKPLGEQNIYEFTMLNGTSASITIPIKPSANAEFPLNLDLFLTTWIERNGQVVSKELKNASATLSPNPIVFKTAADQANLTLTFTARSATADTVYEIGLGRSLGVGAAETLGTLFYLRIKPAYRTNTAITATTTITTTTITQVSTTTSTITEVAISTATTTATTTLLEKVTEPSTYAWAIGATIIAATFAVVLIRRKG